MAARPFNDGVQVRSDGNVDQNEAAMGCGGDGRHGQHDARSAVADIADDAFDLGIGGLVEQPCADPANRILCTVDRRTGRQVDDDHELRSEEHTSELQLLMRISYAVFCLKKKKST